MDIVKVIDRLHAKCISGNDDISTILLKLMKNALVILFFMIKNCFIKVSTDLGKDIQQNLLHFN